MRARLRCSPGSALVGPPVTALIGPPVTALLGALAALLLTLGGAGCARESGTREYREVVFEVLRHPERIEIVRQPDLGQVAVAAIAPRRATQGGAGQQPSLVVPPGALVRCDLPDLGSGTQLLVELAVAARGQHEPPPEPRPVRFLGRLDGRVVIDERLSFGAEGERSTGEWFPVRVDVPRGGLLELEVESAGDLPLEPGFGRLVLDVPRRVSPGRSSPQRPNLVFVVIDTLRADRLGAYGYGRPTSPALDGLAARGVLYEQAWSVAPWTWPSTASLFTALEPPEHGVLNRFSCYLPEVAETLAERLRVAGWRCVGFSSNPLISAAQNFGQGFERFELDEWARSASFLDPALDFLGEVGDERFLLYLHLTDPHLPFEPEPQWRARLGVGPAPLGFAMEDLGARLEALPADDPWRLAALQHTSDLYDAEVAAADDGVGRLLAALEAAGLAERTLVVVTSDHGEELLEHGRLGHSHQLFRESLAVPLLAAGPGLPRGLRLAAPVQNHRLLPSVLAWLGLPADAELPAPLPLADQAGPHEPLRFSTEVGDWQGERPSARLLGRRTGDELVLWMEQGARLARFDTANDPGELEDLHSADPQPGQRARAALQRWWQAAEARRPGPIAASEETADLLRRLGYLEDR
jgi:arylsulfatase A-like enzyme